VKFDVLIVLWADRTIARWRPYIRL